MCGITGVLNLENQEPIEDAPLRQMLGMLRHRGPDGYGIYCGDQVSLGSARLSIIDLAGGDQPITNEDGSLWIVFNGEIFNYVELRPGLESRGHRFTTQSDTEVILHLYEEHGPACLQHLNGQFTFAIWDNRTRSLFIARDRLGIRPLFYTRSHRRFIFASEIKAILAYPGISAEIDPIGLDQVFTFWSTLSPRTVFKDIVELPPGHFLLARDGEISIQPYWRLDFAPDPEANRSIDSYLDELESLLVDATHIRLRADVPVGAYLSGGLDSSTIAAIIRSTTQNHLDTFSISFSDPHFDESGFQRKMARFLGTDHQVVYADYADIGRVFPDVIWHTETPILRTAPAPLFLLSQLVRENHYKVVLTGEGADEVLGGYDIFKEAKIRRFWARQPDSKIRPLLLQRIYPDIAGLPNRSAYLASFFRERLTDVTAPEYSHRIRWRTTSRAKRFFSADTRLALSGRPAPFEADLFYPPQFSNWDPLSQAQYLESSIFLSQYLLSSQGDRMAMAHSVEGRFPFLDFRLVEFCNRLPPNLKLYGLQEKYLLRKLASQWLPEEIWKRPKRPYRAPIHRSFFGDPGFEYVREMLSPEYTRSVGFFQGDAVRQMVKKIEGGRPLGETDDMALAGILSTHLVYQQFVADFRLRPPIANEENLKLCIGNRTPIGGARENWSRSA